MNDWFALSGVPAGHRVYEKLPVRRHAFVGMETEEERRDWRLDSFVEEILDLYTEESILLGQDLGGLVAAMACLRKKPKALILTGTALNKWWNITRYSALPLLHHLFYGAFQGRLFRYIGQGREMGKDWGLPLEDGIRAKRMRVLARHMRPPIELMQKIKTICPIFLIWGTRDIVYPMVLGSYMAHKLQAPIFWIRGGHYCMWNQPDPFLQCMHTIEASLDKETRKDT